MSSKSSQPEHAILATLAVVALVAHLPLLMLHADNLWHQRPHYQFFPLVIVAVILLLAQRWPQQLAPVSRWQFRFGCLLLAIGLTLLTGAVVLFSPSLAMLAFVVSGAGVLQLSTGPDFLKEFLPVWLLLLIVPPPWKLDLEFILALQSATSAAASSLLYSLDIPHVATGNVFRLPGQELFVAEACSGIHSQLALVVTSLIVAAMLRRSFIHSVMLALSAIFWSFVTNVIRVSLVVAAEVRWGRNIADGWEHEVLGYLLMITGLVLMLLTDQLLKGLLKPIADEQRWEVAPVRFLRQESLPYRVETILLRCWNLLFASRFEAPEASDGDDVVETASESANLEPAIGPALPTIPFMTRLRGSVLLASGLAFVALGTVQGAVLVARGEVRPINADDLLAMIGREWVADATTGVEVSNYREIVRETNSDSGQYSRSWTLTDVRQRETIWSIDFPFSGWHELSRCYTGQGWTIEERRPCRAADLDYVEVHLRHGTNWYGLLFFALTDPEGQSLAPRSNHWRGWRSRLMTSPTTQWLQRKSDWEVADAVSIQLQLFSQMRTRLDSELVEERRAQFLELVESSRRQFRQHSQASDGQAVLKESQP